MNKTYKTRKETCEMLGIYYHTLYKLAKNNEIEVLKIGKHHVYNAEKYLRDNRISKNKRRKICYCRVSSKKQSEDLKRQIEYMKNKYKDYEIIYDIASGLNFNRKGLNKIIDYAINGEIEILIITYKDRLARFGYELIENIIKKYSNANIKIENSKNNTTPHEEITKDIISIMNIYVAKINGLRKYKK